MIHVPPHLSARFNSGLWAIVVLVAIEALNNLLTKSLLVDSLAPVRPVIDVRAIYPLGHAVIVLALVGAVVLWWWDRRQRLQVMVSIINTLFTLQLFGATLLLVLRLAQSMKVTVGILLGDACVIFLTNILIFALWYWLIDSAKAGFFVVDDDAAAWDFLFPQRQADYPGHDSWRPHFFDYVFLAFTTSVAFSPTDTLPLTRSAKLLMMAQAGIALITITVVAGTAINILANTA